MSSAPKFCSNCGEPTEPGDQFCGKCGFSFVAAPAIEQPPSQSLPSIKKKRPRRRLRIFMLFAAMAVVAGVFFLIPEIMEELQPNPICSVAFAPNGKTLAVSSMGGTIRLWDTTNGKQIAVFQSSTEGAYSLAFSQDGGTLAAGRFAGSITIIDLQNGQTKQTLTGHSSTVCALAFSANGDALFSGDQAKAVKVWEWPSGNFLGGLEESPSSVKTAAFSPDSNLYGWIDNDGQIQVFTRINMARISVLGPMSDYPDSFAFHPNNFIVAAGESNIITFWDLRSGRRIDSLDFPTPSLSIYSLTFSPDGKTIAVGFQNGIAKIIDLQSKKELATLYNKEWWQIVPSHN